MIHSIHPLADHSLFCVSETLKWLPPPPPLLSSPLLYQILIYLSLILLRATSLFLFLDYHSHWKPAASEQTVMRTDVSTSQRLVLIIAMGIGKGAVACHGVTCFLPASQRALSQSMAFPAPPSLWVWASDQHGNCLWLRQMPWGQGWWQEIMSSICPFSHTCCDFYTAKHPALLLKGGKWDGTPVWSPQSIKYSYC